MKHELDLTAIRQRAEAATPGPWQVGDGIIWRHGPLVGDVLEVIDDGSGGTVGCATPEDAAHIAGLAPLVVLALVDELERLREAP